MDARADVAAVRAMSWPWEGHEECEVHRVFTGGAECGRVCLACNVIEYHLMITPGQSLLVGTFQIGDVVKAN